MASAPTPPAASSGSGLTNNVAAMLCYLPLCFIGIIAAIIFLVMEPYKNNRFVRFNAFQSIFLHVGLIVLSIAWQIIVFILAFLSHGIAGLLSVPVSLLVGLGILALMIYMCIQAYGNKEVKLPFIGDLAAKQAGN
jgi:uncharacterized membrane protein